LEFGVWSLEFGVGSGENRSGEFGVWSLVWGVWRIGDGSLEFGVWCGEFEVRSRSIIQRN